VQVLATVVGTAPLTVHFSLHNPAETNHPVAVPRTLAPLGVFVRGTVRDAKRRVVYDGPDVRATHRIDPGSPTSYLDLGAGYTFGAVFEFDEVNLPAGDYVLTLSYANDPFLGTPEKPVGPVRLKATLPFRVG
jgi:hypothetical protein